MQPSPGPNPGPTTLLVIDDDPEVLAATARLLLTHDGYQVICGATAAEAVSLTYQHKPAILLLDVMLPDGNGLDVGKKVKGDPALRGVFVVLLSAFLTSAEDQAWGLSMGLADGYIIRPFSGPEFLARIDALLRLRAAQEELREALQEKEALLKETHHRLKNNLALILSLMRIGAGRSREPETKAVLLEMQERIHSVLLLNETLYKTASYARVNLAAYLRQVATHAFRAQSPGEVRLEMDLAPVEIETVQAIPCGLIVNELLTNSLKHAFPRGHRGEVRVGLREAPGGWISLCVSDTGVGLPEDFASRRRDSAGLQLVDDLVRQLRGTLTLTVGATFTINFPPGVPGTGSIPRPAYES